ncbi:YwqG family protein [Nonomuraea sp. NPDC049695]|uniref:YwqG family protein n=1 Tax=Nonomuraea sp. NPDC049695 TaxID=3154734 RepID=UPI0034260BEC
MRRSALRIWPGEQVAPDAAGSRLGGRPLAAPGTSWPTWEGDPLDLLAQIDLVEVARLLPGNPLPDHGLLSFFYDTKTPAWGVVPSDPAGWRVRWERGPVEPIALPEGWGMFPAREVRWEPLVTLPRATEEYVDFIEAMEDTSTTKARSALDDAIGPGPAHHQLLGWPHLLQGSMHWSCQKESTFHRGDRPQYHPDASLTQDDWDELETDTRSADWQLLLQLGSEEMPGWCWGDGGGLYFWIRRADLAARRFDQVWTVMQC